MKKSRSAMVKNWAAIPSANIPRSKFNLNKTYKTTFDASYLIPFCVEEVVPGDTHSITANIFARLATPLKPIMDNVFIDQHWFFVPNRLVWENWERFMGAQDNPGDSTDYVIPIMNSSGGFQTPMNIFDYMGIPMQVPDLDVNALPFRCYNLIYNQWFRSQDLQDSVPENKGDGVDNTGDYVLQKRGKRHDYFTSCLPWPQKGPGVDLPLGQDAPIYGDGSLGGSIRMLTEDKIEDTTYTWVHQDTATESAQFGTGGTLNPANIFADLSNATAATINDLRQAFQIQKLQERDARGGTRYQELVMAHFNVRGGDARLQRAEFLGGGTTPLGITQVPQTSGTAVDPETGYSPNPQGNLAAFGTAMGKAGFTKSFTEHGYIIGLVSARADLTYQQGLDKKWTRRTKYDFYWPALSRIGEQAVKNQEIYAQGTDQDDEVFGYQERYAEMRYGKNQLTGLFRSNAATSLDVWHLAQDFETLPALNDEFIEENVPLDRVIAVPDEPHFLCDMYIQHTAARPMPISGAPGYIDHF